MSILTGKKITVIVTGSIAAYKGCEVVRLLRAKGAFVHVILTAAAKTFVGAMTFEALSGNAVLSDDASSALAHIELSQNQTDLILVVPATANTLAKAACGIADNLASATILARKAPLAFVPAMNSAMWSNPATQRNVATLKNDGAVLIGPADGPLACGQSGTGRMVEPGVVVEAVEKILSPSFLKGKKVLVTAGPTFEAIDPVRGLTNRSSGKQGYAVAKAACEAGADVTLITGPCALKPPYGVKTVAVESALQMADAVQKHLPGTDAFIGVAAVADWRSTQVSERKLKKSIDSVQTLQLEENPDILKTVSESTLRPKCVAGFAAETEQEIAYAQKKLQAKKLDIIVANNAASTFGHDKNTAVFITADGIERLPELNKIDLARHLVARIAQMMEKS